jgi:hypothetical protein
MVVERIVSGGQTGVDRAALTVAQQLGIPCGGWCPRGRRAEDGRIPSCFSMQETPSRAYPQRTEWNVRDSDGTLVLTVGGPDRGTALTLALAARHHKPCLRLDLRSGPTAASLSSWVQAHGVRKLNVAGPRESRAPGIGAAAAAFLRVALA